MVYFGSTNGKVCGWDIWGGVGYERIGERRIGQEGIFSCLPRHGHRFPSGSMAPLAAWVATRAARARPMAAQGSKGRCRRKKGAGGLAMIPDRRRRRRPERPNPERERRRSPALQSLNLEGLLPRRQGLARRPRGARSARQVRAGRRGVSFPPGRPLSTAVRSHAPPGGAPAAGGAPPPIRGHWAGSITTTEGCNSMALGLMSWPPPL